MKCCWWWIFQMGSSLHVFRHKTRKALWNYLVWLWIINILKHHKTYYKTTHDCQIWERLKFKSEKKCWGLELNVPGLFRHKYFNSGGKSYCVTACLSIVISADLAIANRSCSNLFAIARSTVSTMHVPIYSFPMSLVLWFYGLFWHLTIISIWWYEATNKTPGIKCCISIWNRQLAERFDVESAP